MMATAGVHPLTQRVLLALKAMQRSGSYEAQLLKKPGEIDKWTLLIGETAACQDDTVQAQATTLLTDFKLVGIIQSNKEQSFGYRALRMRDNVACLLAKGLGSVRGRLTEIDPKQLEATTEVFSLDTDYKVSFLENGALFAHSTRPLPAIAIFGIGLAAAGFGIFIGAPALAILGITLASLPTISFVGKQLQQRTISIAAPIENTLLNYVATGKGPHVAEKIDQALRTHDSRTTLSLAVMEAFLLETVAAKLIERFDWVSVPLPNELHCAQRKEPDLRPTPVPETVG